MKVPTERPWLTYAGDRRPHFKSHATHMDARRAVYGKLDRATLRLTGRVNVFVWGENEAWTLVWDLPEGTHESALPWNVGISPYDGDTSTRGALN